MEEFLMMKQRWKKEVTDVGFMSSEVPYKIVTVFYPALHFLHTRMWGLEEE